MNSYKAASAYSLLEKMAATHAHRTHSHNLADEEAAATERDAGSGAGSCSQRNRENFIALR